MEKATRPDVNTPSSDVEELTKEASRPDITMLPSSDMEVVFLGTASCTPTPNNRGVSCTALKKNGDCMIFDAGEGAQIQFQQCGAVRPASVSWVLVTHLHGDHSYGLPGLMCLLTFARMECEGPLEIVGPRGLRFMIRSLAQLTRSHMCAYRVHELHDVPDHGADFHAIDKNLQDTRVNNLDTAMKSFPADIEFGEVDGGKDIIAVDGVWTIPIKTFGKAPIAIKAASIKHTIPCVGYTVEEEETVGSLQAKTVLPLLMKNEEAFKAQGVQNVKKMLGTLKKLASEGKSYTLPDGTVLQPDDIVSPSRPGRKVVILGDTCGLSDAMERLIMNANFMVHEATNTFLPGDDGTVEDLEENTISHGHSTPFMAGRVAKRCNVQRLALTHFSPRYKGNTDPESLATMATIEEQARSASGLEGLNVVAAWDFCVLPVPRRS